MKSKILLILLLHFIIVAGYTAVTSYMFVKYPVPDPIGTGLQQWVCTILHMVVTALVCLILRMKAADKKAATTTLLINLGVITFWTVANLALSIIYWEYLWSLRPENTLT